MWKNPICETLCAVLPYSSLLHTWGQPIKLIQVASTSELHENQWNDLIFFAVADVTYLNITRYVLDILWGQPIKLVQVASTSEFRENQRNNLLFFEMVSCHSCGA